MLNSLSFAIVIPVLMAYSSPSTTTKPMIDFTYHGEILGDPYGTQGAPQIVPFSEISIWEQPGAPFYPPQAKHDGVQGDILVEVWLGSDGSPTEAHVLAGPNELRETAISYILKWKFKPVNPDKNLFPARFRMVMPFRLNRNGGPIVPLPKKIQF